MQVRRRPRRRRHAATRLTLLFLLSLDNPHFAFGLHDAGLQVVDSAHGIVHLFQRDPYSGVHLRRTAKREVQIHVHQPLAVRTSS